MANIVEIVIKGIDATKAPFTQSINNFESLKKAAIGLGTVGMGAILALQGTLVALTEKSIESAAEMGHLAQSAGMSVEEFSKLAYAAKISKVGVDSLATGMKQFNKSIVEAAGNASSEQAKAFQAMGISLRDNEGQVRKNGEVLLDVATKFHSYADGAEKSALSLKLFGKTGTDMIPMLNRSGEGIKQLEAETSGVTESMAQQAETYEENLIRLKGQFSSMGKIVAKEVLPALVSVSEWMVQTSKDTQTFQSVASGAVFILKAFVGGLYALWTGFKIVGIVIGAVAGLIYEQWINRIQAAIQIAGLWSDAIGNTVRSLINMGRAAGTVGDILSDFFAGDYESAFEKAKTTAGTLGDEMENIRKSTIQTWKDTADIVGTTFAKNGAAAEAVFHQTVEDIKKEWSSLEDLSEALFGNKSQTVTTDHENKPAPIVVDTSKQEESDKRRMESLRRLAEMERQLRNEQLSGADAVMAKIDDNYQRRVEQIGKLDLTEEESLTALQTAYQNFGEQQIQAYLDGTLAKAEIDKQYRDGNIAGLIQFYQTQHALDLQDLESKRALMNTYEQLSRKSHQNIFNFANSMAQSFSTGLSSALTSIIMRTKSAGEAFKEFGLSMVNAVVNFVTEWVAARLTQLALEAIFGSTVAATSAATAATVAAAWAPAAALVSTATFGAAGAAGAAGLSIAYGFAQGLAAVGGVAHGGLDFVPGESTYLLQRGERVLQPKANQDLTNFLDNQGEGGGGPTQVNVYLDGSVLFSSISRATRDGRINIHGRSII